MVSLESEGEMTRSEVATFLRDFADELDEGTVGAGDERVIGEAESTADTAAEPGETKRMTFIIGGDSATVIVPDTVNFEVDIESRSPLFSSGVQQDIEFELSWEVENVDEDGMDEESIHIE